MSHHEERHNGNLFSKCAQLYNVLLYRNFSVQPFWWVRTMNRITIRGGLREQPWMDRIIRSHLSIDQHRSVDYLVGKQTDRVEAKYSNALQFPSPRVRKTFLIELNYLFISNSRNGTIQTFLPLWSIFMNENGVRYFDVNHALISHTYAISSDIALPVFLRIVTICSKIHSSSGNVTYVKFWTDQSACSLARNTPSALVT